MDVLTTYVVAWPKRISISPTFTDPVIHEYCRLLSTSLHFRQPMNWTPFEDAPRTCAAFPASRILDDSSTCRGTSKTEPWVTPVSTSNFTREAPIAQARDMPPLLSDPCKTPRYYGWASKAKIIIIVWMSTEGKETGATSADVLSPKILPGMLTLGYCRLLVNTSLK